MKRAEENRYQPTYRFEMACSCLLLQVLLSPKDAAGYIMAHIAMMQQETLIQIAAVPLMKQ